MHKLSLSVGTERLAIVQLKPGKKIPKDLDFGSIWSVIRTPDEISLIIPEDFADSYHKFEKGWRYLKMDGVFDFNQVGLLASLLNTLADGNIGILAFSTYNTDYILIKDENLEKAIALLSEEGHSVKKSV